MKKEKALIIFEMAEKRILQEKALRGEDVVVYGEDNVIRYIPAKQVIEENPMHHKGTAPL